MVVKRARASLKKSWTSGVGGRIGLPPSSRRGGGRGAVTPTGTQPVTPTLTPQAPISPASNPSEPLSTDLWRPQGSESHPQKLFDIRDDGTTSIYQPHVEYKKISIPGPIDPSTGEQMPSVPASIFCTPEQESGGREGNDGWLHLDQDDIHLDPHHPNINTARVDFPLLARRPNRRTKVFISHAHTDHATDQKWADVIASPATLFFMNNMWQSGSKANPTTGEYTPRTLKKAGEIPITPSTEQGGRLVELEHGWIRLVADSHTEGSAGLLYYPKAWGRTTGPGGMVEPWKAIWYTGDFKPDPDLSVDEQLKKFGRIPGIKDVHTIVTEGTHFNLPPEGTTDYFQTEKSIDPSYIYHADDKEELEKMYQEWQKHLNGDIVKQKNIPFVIGAWQFGKAQDQMKFWIGKGVRPLVSESIDHWTQTIDKYMRANGATETPWIDDQGRKKYDVLSYDETPRGQVSKVPAFDEYIKRRLVSDIPGYQWKPGERIWDFIQKDDPRFSIIKQYLGISNGSSPRETKQALRKKFTDEYVMFTHSLLKDKVEGGDAPRVVILPQNWFTADNNNNSWNREHTKFWWLTGLGSEEGDMKIGYHPSTHDSEAGSKNWYWNSNKLVFPSSASSTGGDQGLFGQNPEAGGEAGGMGGAAITYSTLSSGSSGNDNEFTWGTEEKKNPGSEYRIRHIVSLNRPERFDPWRAMGISMQQGGRQVSKRYSPVGRIPISAHATPFQMQKLLSGLSKAGMRFGFTVHPNSDAPSLLAEIMGNYGVKGNLIGRSNNGNVGLFNT